MCDCTCGDVATACTCISSGILWWFQPLKKMCDWYEMLFGHVHEILAPAKISEILRVTASSTISPNPFPFVVLVFSNLVVLVFCAGNQHTDFVVFFSYFAMIVSTKWFICCLCEGDKFSTEFLLRMFVGYKILHHILFMRKRQISLFAEISYPHPTNQSYPASNNE